MGSYLHARASGGRWLLRIEDLDTTRSVPNAESQILRALETCGFEWDGTVLRQSERTDRYAAALETLKRAGQLFRCGCSRRDIAAATGSTSLQCIGQCATHQQLVDPQHCSVRWDAGAHRVVDFDDLWQGRQHTPAATLGDLVLRRRDGLHAYQLAVVIDDAEQGVNHVVRGADLLDSTAWQILLQDALGLPRPAYGHLPLLVEPDGRKLAKSRRSAPIEGTAAGPLLFTTLLRLAQSPPAELASAAVRDLWAWALSHWQPHTLQGLRCLPAAAPPGQAVPEATVSPGRV